MLASELNKLLEDFFFWETSVANLNVHIYQNIW